MWLLYFIYCLWNNTFISQQKSSIKEPACKSRERCDIFVFYIIGPKLNDSLFRHYLKIQNFRITKNVHYFCFYFEMNVHDTEQSIK